GRRARPRRGGHRPLRRPAPAGGPRPGPGHRRARARAPRAHDGRRRRHRAPGRGRRAGAAPGAHDGGGDDQPDPAGGDRPGRARRRGPGGGRGHPRRAGPGPRDVPGGSAVVSAALPVADAAATRAAVAAVVRRHAGPAVAAALALLGATIAALAVPRLLGDLVDVVVDRGARGELDRTLVVLAVAAVAEGALTAAGLAAVGALSERGLAGLREAAVDRALALPLSE